MTEQGITLIDPTEDLADEFVAYSEEFRAAGESFVHGELDKAGGDFTKLLGKWRDQAAGRNLPENHVPASVHCLVCSGRLLATSRLRHRLTEALEDLGGHIGYEVRPGPHGGKGYGTLLLKLTLDKARLLDIGRAVTCDKDNIASARVIQNNGGVLDSQSVSKQSGRMTQRYWIELD